MNSITETLNAANLNWREATQIAEHLKCGIRQVLEIRCWYSVLWVKFQGTNGKKYCRFVSYREIRQKFPKTSGLYWMNNKVVRIEVADNSFRILKPDTRKVLGWVELYPCKMYNENGNEVSTKELRSLDFRPYKEEVITRRSVRRAA